MDPHRRHQELMQFGPGASPKDLFKDFKARRSAILKALTTDVKKFHQECGSENQEMCLYGYSDGNWQVVPPAEDAPSGLPEPVVGINFARSMPRMAWLALCAAYSDSWLYSLSFFYAIRCGFSKGSRSKLFEMINSLPTICEIVYKNKVSPTSKSSNPTNVSQAPSRTQRKEESTKNMDKGKVTKEEEEREEEENEAGSEPCGHCGDSDDDIDNFWICCDICNRWFHGECVGITPARAEHMKQYSCHKCARRRLPLN